MQGTGWLRLFGFGAAILFAGILQAQTAGSLKPRVEMEVIVDPGLQATVAAQRWSKALGELGLDNVQFRPIRNGDRVEVQQQPGGQTGLVRITAQLNSRGALVTAGGQFLASDTARLKRWLAEVQSGGGIAGERKTVFGLTGEQFRAVKNALSPPVAVSTKGLRPEKAIAEIKSGLSLSLVIDPVIERAILADEAVRDELKGVSAGAALAAIARPAGGILLPRVAGKDVQLAIASPTTGGELWPIGWPPEEKDEQKLAPALYDFINVNIDGVPASEAINALQGRLNIPMLFDYNGMVRQRIDLKKPVKVPPGKTYYRRIFERVLNQAGLRSELRVDDAGKPLIWIMPM